MMNVRTMLRPALLIAITFLTFTEARAEDYALLVSGGVSPRHNFARHYRNLKKVHGALMERGIPRERIMTLYANGSASEKNTTEDGIFFQTVPKGISESLVGDGKSDISGPATKDEFLKSLESLANKLKPGDHLLLFITDHGGAEWGAAFWGGKFVDEAALSKALEKFPKGVKIHTVTTFCYGGRYAAATTGDRCFISNTDAAHPALSDATNDPYVDAFLEGWKDKKEKKSLLEAAEHAKAEDSGNEHQMTSLDFFMEKYKKTIAQRKARSETCAACSEGRIETGAEISGQIAKALLVNDTEDESVKNFRQNELKERLKQIEKELTSGKHAELEREAAALAAELKKIGDAWAALSPEQQSEQRAKYTRDIERLAKNIREKSAKILNLRSAHSRALWELDFVQYATPEELKDYVELRKCLDYTF